MARDERFDHCFNPQEDITAFELAKIIALMKLTAKDEVLKDPTISRHFNKPKGWWEDDDG